MPQADVQKPGAEVSPASRELATMHARRAELTGQLSGIEERREALREQMSGSEGSTRADFVARIRTQDARAARIELELNGINDRIAGLVARGVTPPPSGFDRLIQGANAGAPRTTPGAAVTPENPFDSEWGILFGGMVLMQGLTLALLAVVVWQSFRRHTFGRLARDDANRLEQLQRSMDVMAVEVERISESQRFTAKMLNEQALEPVKLGKDVERVR
jgi:hypothetical protein